MLLTKELELAITARTVNHYKAKGYDIPMKYSVKSKKMIIDTDTKVVVKVEDLPDNSKVMIEYKCDCCGGIFTTTYCLWNNRAYPDLGTVCKKCAVTVKLPKAMNDKYGCDNCANASAVIEKKKETCRKKYGNDWSIASEEVKDKIIDSFLNKYNTTNPMKTEKVKDKAKATNMQKFGGHSAMCDENVRRKSIETCLKKYGVSNPFQSKEIQAKARQTLCKNGNVPSSKAEKSMCRMLKSIYGKENCFPNYPVNNLSLDCLLIIDGERIDVEYDGYYWHKNRGQKDAARNAVLMAEGYKIIRIKANNQDTMPTKEQIKQAVDYLVKGNHKLTFINMNE